MVQFSYIAISRNGNRIIGDVDAVSRDDVLRRIALDGHLAVDVRPLAGPVAGKPLHAATAAALFSRRLSKAESELFPRELSMLLKAGLTLDPALKLLAQNSGSPRFTAVMSSLRSKIGDGMSLHAALCQLPELLPSIYVNMIRVAEVSGTLDVVLSRIATAMEREQKLKAKIISALIYPGFLIATAFCAIILMIGFVVPQFKKMISSTGGAIPENTRVLIAVSDWLTANAWSLAAACLAAVAGLIVAFRQASMRRALGHIVLGLPVAGNLLRLNYTIRFCRSLGTMLENGVDLPEALHLSYGVLGNLAAADAIAQARENLRKGEDFTGPLSQSGLFFPVAINLLNVGMETGSLAPSALHLADMFEDKLERAITRTFTILEPLIIIFISAFVAAIIMTIIGAIISINDIII